MSENDFKKEFQKYIKKTYPNAWGYKSSDRFTVGIHDMIYCIKGRFVSIELKFGSNGPTKMQARNVIKITIAGGITGVAWNIEDVKRILKEGGL